MKSISQTFKMKHHILMAFSFLSSNKKGGIITVSEHF